LETDRERLRRCFALALPGVEEEALDKASPATVPAWDSGASVTLFALIEETFGIALEPEDLEQFTSFESVLALVETKQRAS
jgi:acyl carrier protein